MNEQKADADRQIWETALIKVGVWKRGQVCVQCNWMHNGQHPHHPSPAPTIGDAEATLAMLEWFRDKRNPLTLHYTRDEREMFEERWRELLSANSLPLAIAAAVCAVKVNL